MHLQNGDASRASRHLDKCHFGMRPLYRSPINETNYRPPRPDSNAAYEEKYYENRLKEAPDHEHVRELLQSAREQVALERATYAQ